MHIHKYLLQAYPKSRQSDPKGNMTNLPWHHPRSPRDPVLEVDTYRPPRISHLLGRSNRETTAIWVAPLMRATQIEKTDFAKESDVAMRHAHQPFSAVERCSCNKGRCLVVSCCEKLSGGSIDLEEIERLVVPIYADLCDIRCESVLVDLQEELGREIMYQFGEPVRVGHDL